MRGRWFAATAASLLLAVACAPPMSKVDVQSSPTPSPSPTPTVPVAVSARETFHGGEVGVGYSPVALSATGGAAPYKWSVSSGVLPSGLNLDSGGSVAGTPNTAGSFTFTVQVADSGGGSATLPGTISIAGALSAGLIPACASYCNVEIGCASVCGTFAQQSGGVGPYAYTMTQGPLPAGTSLNGLSLAGTFSGLSGWLQFTVQVADALGATATIAPKFWMYDHITMASGSCYSTYYPFPCSTSLPFSGGIPNTGFSVAIRSATGQLCTRGATGAWVCNSSSSPPPGFTATVGNRVVDVKVPGQPNNPFEYSGTVTLDLTDQDPCGSAVNCRTTATVKVTFAGG